MFVSCASMEVVLFSAIVEDVQRFITQLVLSVPKHSSDQDLNGTVVGIYVRLVRRILSTCAILVLILCARDALEAQSMFLYGRTKASVGSA